MPKKKVKAHEVIGKIIEILEPFDIGDRKRVIAAVDAYVSTETYGLWSGTWVARKEGEKDEDVTAPR